MILIVRGHINLKAEKYAVPSLWETSGCGSAKPFGKGGTG